MASIQGLDKLLAKLTKLDGDVNNALSKSIERNIKRVQSTAKRLAPVNDGYLRNSIQGEVKSEGNKIEGRVSTAVNYAHYVEFGTGPVGMASHKDLPHKILSKLVYKQNGWWIHESDIDAKTAAKYHFEKRKTKNGVFYYTEGQPAQPFLYPALVQNEGKIAGSVRYDLQKEIKKLEKEKGGS